MSKCQNVSPEPVPIPARIRVFVVDDDVVFLRHLVAAIEGASDMLLSGVANTQAQALTAITAQPADVLVVDLGLPDGSGVEVIRAAHRAWPSCAIMVSTTFADEAHVINSIEAGATGYLLKDSSSQRLTEDIRTIHAGGSPISPMIARYVLQRFRQGESSAPVPTLESPHAAPSLSPRELEVLGLITKGFTYEEIAGLLKVSRNTVMTFVRRIYTKLEVKSKVEAIDEARHQGLLNY